MLWCSLEALLVVFLHVVESIPVSCKRKEVENVSIFSGKTVTKRDI